MNTVIQYIIWILAGFGAVGILYYLITYLISIWR